MKTMNDDRIFRSTRLVAVMVVPFLVLAFIILYFKPHPPSQSPRDESAELEEGDLP